MMRITRRRLCCIEEGSTSSKTLLTTPNAKRPSPWSWASRKSTTTDKGMSRNGPAPPIHRKDTGAHSNNRIVERCPSQHHGNKHAVATMTPMPLNHGSNSNNDKNDGDLQQNKNGNSIGNNSIIDQHITPSMLHTLRSDDPFLMEVLDRYPPVPYDACYMVPLAQSSDWESRKELRALMKERHFRSQLFISESQLEMEGTLQLINPTDSPCLLNVRRTVSLFNIAQVKQCAMLASKLRRISRCVTSSSSSSAGPSHTLKTSDTIDWMGDLATKDEQAAAERRTAHYWSTGMTSGWESISFLALQDALDEILHTTPPPELLAAGVACNPDCDSEDDLCMPPYWVRPATLPFHSLCVGSPFRVTFMEKRSFYNMSQLKRTKRSTIRSGHCHYLGSTGEPLRPATGESLPSDKKMQKNKSKDQDQQPDQGKKNTHRDGIFNYFPSELPFFLKSELASLHMKPIPGQEDNTSSIHRNFSSVVLDLDDSAVLENDAKDLLSSGFGPFPQPLADDTTTTTSLEPLRIHVFNQLKAWQSYPAHACQINFSPASSYSPQFRLQQHDSAVTSSNQSDDKRDTPGGEEREGEAFHRSDLYFVDLSVATELGLCRSANQQQQQNLTRDLIRKVRMDPATRPGLLISNKSVTHVTDTTNETCVRSEVDSVSITTDGCHESAGSSSDDHKRPSSSDWKEQQQQQQQQQQEAIQLLGDDSDDIADAARTRTMMNDDVDHDGVEIIPDVMGPKKINVSLSEAVASAKTLSDDFVQGLIKSYDTSGGSQPQGDKEHHPYEGEDAQQLKQKKYGKGRSGLHLKDNNIPVPAYDPMAPVTCIDLSGIAVFSYDHTDEVYSAIQLAKYSEGETSPKQEEEKLSKAL